MGKNLREKFSDAVTSAKERRKIEGTLGLPLGNDEYEQGPDANNPYLQWVVVEQDGGMTSIVAYNNTVPFIPGIRVILEQEKDQTWVVSGPDSQRAITQMGAQGQNVHAAPHVHSIGSGMDDPVEGLRFVPGACWYVEDGNGFEFVIEPFWYRYNGKAVYFGGGTIDISAHQPASEEQVWVKIGVSPTTNLATSQVGSSYSAGFVLPVDFLSLIETSLIELMGVKIYGDDADVGDYERFEDIRFHISRADSGGGDQSLLWMTM